MRNKPRFAHSWARHLCAKCSFCASERSEATSCPTGTLGGHRPAGRAHRRNGPHIRRQPQRASWTGPGATGRAQAAPRAVPARGEGATGDGHATRLSSAGAGRGVATTAASRGGTHCALAPCPRRSAASIGTVTLWPPTPRRVCGGRQLRARCALRTALRGCLRPPCGAACAPGAATGAAPALCAGVAGLLLRPPAAGATMRPRPLCASCLQAPIAAVSVISAPCLPLSVPQPRGRASP